MTNLERAFSTRPEVFAAWNQLNGSIKARMDLRRYKLATLAAARRLRSSYCCLAHGTVLLKDFGEPVREIALDHRAAGLDDVDIAVMDLAERVVDDATSIEDSELQRLRDLGLSDEDMMDVVMAAAARLLLEDARRARRPRRQELQRARPRAARGSGGRPADSRRLGHNQRQWAHLGSNQGPPACEDPAGRYR